MASWIQIYDPELVARRMEKVKKSSNDGKVTFDAFEHSEHVVLLNSMITLDKEVPEIEKRRIINRATFNAGAKGKINAKMILGEVGKLEHAYLSKSKKKFRLITEISISRSCQLPRIYYEGSCIIINAHLNARTKNHRNKLLAKAKSLLTNDLPKDYAAVSVSVRARSVAEATDIALDRLDFIRGIWNLWKNRRHDFRMSYGKRYPVNCILLGPIHTLHNIDGTLAGNSWWYEPQYQGPVKVFENKEEIKGMYKDMTAVRELLKKSNYAPDIIRAILRYVRSLDARDWDGSFLRLWGVLELLTGTLSDSYKVTIRRASHIFGDREYVRQVLSHLKEYRNKSVHAGWESEDIESLMYQLKRFVEALIRFHLRYRFLSLSDAAAFMSLPDDEGLIDRKIERLRYAKKVISGS